MQMRSVAILVAGLASLVAARAEDDAKLLRGAPVQTMQVLFPSCTIATFLACGYEAGLRGPI